MSLSWQFNADDLGIDSMMKVDCADLAADHVKIFFATVIMIVVEVQMMLMVVVVVLMMIMMMISKSSSYHHDCGTGPCGHLCRANSIRDTVPSRESHVLNEPTFTFYLHFLLSKLPFTSHKNLCCFFYVTSPTSTQLVAKDFAFSIKSHQSSVHESLHSPYV